MRIAGCTVHFVVPEMDAGPIIAQAAVPVITGDTAESLAVRILAVEHTLYPHALRLVVSGSVRMHDGRAVWAPGRGAQGVSSTGQAAELVAPTLGDPS